MIRKVCKSGTSSLVICGSITLRKVQVVFRPPKILDNKKTGRVYEELAANLKKGSKLSVISAYFTIYAYAELKRELSKIDKMQFIFTEPTFMI